MRYFFETAYLNLIKKFKTYDDGQFLIKIDANPNGCTITWRNKRDNCKDIASSMEDNFNIAYDLMISKFPNAEEMNTIQIEK